MPRFRYWVALTAAVGLVGAGCASAPKATPTSDATSTSNAITTSVNAVTDNVAGDGPGQTLPRQDVQAKSDAWSDYQHATVVTAVSSVSVQDFAKKHVITFNVPTSWVGNGVWRPVKDDPLNYIRARYYTGPNANDAWKSEQAMTDLYDNVHAENQNGNNVMTAIHKALKVAVFKLFATDPKHPDNSYYSIECHIAVDAPNQADLWNACKTAVTSAQFKTE